MDIQKRILDLEEVAREQLAEQNALGIMMMALITTHPNPKALRVAFDTAESWFRTKAGDQGFEHGHPTELAADVVQRTSARLERLRALIPK